MPFINYPKNTYKKLLAIKNLKEEPIIKQTPENKIDFLIPIFSIIIADGIENIIFATIV